MHILDVDAEGIICAGIVLSEKGNNWNQNWHTLANSCIHILRDSFNAQMSRLSEAGYPSNVIVQPCIKLMKWAKGQSPPTNESTKKHAVIPYMHRLSHGLKRVARRYDVSAALSTPLRLRRLCPLIQRKTEQVYRNYTSCKIKHRVKFGPCESAAVYKIPFLCGLVYIGQTGRCLNIRLREHKKDS